MSQLDQAKKEAKRLFNIAKIDGNNHLTVENLSKSREIISTIKGYKNWHECEEVLKRKDFLFNKIDKNTINQNQKQIEQNIDYYIKEIPFNPINNTNIDNGKKTIIDKKHTPIILGSKKQKSLLGNTEKKWLLNNYPALITGVAGAGKTETLLSLTSQYINNNEGFIYFDGKGDFSVYNKIFSYLLEKKSTENLYFLNFSNMDKSKIENTEEIHSHSIDPINPMVGNEQYFNIFFGKFGLVIHEILKEIHKENQLMDISTLESCLMLNNLMDWNKKQKFKTNVIKEYLIDIGLSENEKDNEDLQEALRNHSYCCDKAFQTIKLFKIYPHIFKINCSINMEKIFLERKSLVVLLPALERSINDLSKLGELIASQIRYVDEKYTIYNTHFQNIIFDEFIYFTDCLFNMDFKTTENNYIFGINNLLVENSIVNYILANIKTTILMRCDGPDINLKIKLDLIKLEKFPKLKNNNFNSFIKDFIVELRSLNSGQAYVLSENILNLDYVSNKNSEYINNENKFYCEYVLCEYVHVKYPKNIWLVKHNGYLDNK